MSIFEAVILGFIQGITEFLPISSSGHLVIFQSFFGFSEPPLSFAIFVHFGTLFAIIAAFWGELVELIRHPFQKMTLLLLIATIPTALIGYFFQPVFRELFASLTVVGIGLLITGSLLWISERVTFGFKELRDMSVLDALLIGVIQGIAITPGISRSGATISTGLLAGLDRELAARFSFLLAIPAICGAALLEGKDLMVTGFTFDPIPILSGMIIAAVTGYIAVRYVIKLVKKGKLSVFSYYCWLVGFALLLSQFILSR